MRIDRYWKQTAAGLLTAMILMLTGGVPESFAMPRSQPFTAQENTLFSPDKIIISEEQKSSQAAEGTTADVPAAQSGLSLRLSELFLRRLSIPALCLVLAVLQCWRTMQLKRSSCQ